MLTYVPTDSCTLCSFFPERPNELLSTSGGAQTSKAGMMMMMMMMMMMLVVMIMMMMVMAMVMVI